MRDPKEKKGKAINFKVTESQRKLIENEAAKQGDSITDYVKSKVLDLESKPNPEMLVCVQNIANDATALTEHSDSEYADRIRKEVQKLWSLLR